MIAYRPPIIEETAQDRLFLKFWIALEVLGGQAGIPILLLTLYFSPLRRTPTLYNLLISCVVWSIIDMLLFYPGRVAPSSPQPDYGLCLTQSALKLSQPILTGCCAFSLLYDSWTVISGNSEGPKHPSTIRRITILVVFPWVVFAVVTAVALAVGSSFAGDLGRQRHFFFCTWLLRPLSDTTISIAAIATFATTYYTLRGIKLWYNSVSQATEASYASSTASRINPHMFARVLVLGVTELLAVAVSIISVSGVWHSHVLDLLISSIPFAICIIFGTQMDVLNVYIDGARSLGRWVKSHWVSRMRRQPMDLKEAPYGLAYSFDSRVSPVWDGRGMNRPGQDDGFPRGVLVNGQGKQSIELKMSPTTMSPAYIKPYDTRHVQYAQ
jgi:hypothetical protein